MIAEHASTILLVTGVLTAGAIAAAIVPGKAFELLFGSSCDATVRLVVRHWGVLIASIGGLLIYAAYHPDARDPIMVAAAVEKYAIGILVLASPFRTRPVTLFVVCSDAIMATLFAIVLAQGG